MYDIAERSRCFEDDWLGYAPIALAQLSGSLTQRPKVKVGMAGMYRTVQTNCSATADLNIHMPQVHVLNRP